MDQHNQHDQHDSNDAEWRSLANWRWRGPLGVYASARDSRLLVPKKIAMLGWTLNFAHPRRYLAIAGLAALPCVLMIALRLLS